MEKQLKKIKSVLKINSSISNFFFKYLKIKDLRNHPNKTVAIIDESQEFEIDFSNYSIDSFPYWRHFKTFTENATFFSEQSNAYIVSKGIVVNAGNEVILESTIFQLEYLNELYSNHLVVFKNFIPKVKYPKVFPLLNRLDNNYYHWTMESLSRVLLVYEKPFFKDYQVLIKKGGSKFMTESLKFLFNINDNQIIVKGLVKKVKTENALVVSFPHIRNKETQMTNVYYPSIIRKFNLLAHKRIIENGLDTQKSPKNILISRKNAIERRVINEDELLKKLEQYGFQLVYLEELSFVEQITLFYGAEKVIAQHGAGITNIIYGKKTHLIEFFPQERNIRDAFYFAQISAALKFKHDVIEYKSVNLQQDIEIDESLYAEIICKLNP